MRSRSRGEDCGGSASRAARTAGTRRYSSRPMPGYWLPEPGNRKAVLVLRFEGGSDFTYLPVGTELGLLVLARLLPGFLLLFHLAASGRTILNLARSLRKSSTSRRACAGAMPYSSARP